MRVKQRSKIDLVIVDHMQLMGSTGKVRSDYEKFTFDLTGNERDRSRT